MRSGTRGYKLWKLLLSGLGVVLLMGLWTTPFAQTDGPPQYGGILRVAIAGDPPSLDMHQESTFKVMIPMGNCYNTLVRFDPHNYPTIVGDLAESFERSEDGSDPLVGNGIDLAVSLAERRQHQLPRLDEHVVTHPAAIQEVGQDELVAPIE